MKIFIHQKRQTIIKINLTNLNYVQCTPAVKIQKIRIKS